MSSQINGLQDKDCLFLERVLDKLYDFESAPRKKANSQKRKKRKRREEEEYELPTETDICNDSEDISEGDPDMEQLQQPSNEQTGPTIQEQNQVEVVIFKDPTKKLKTNQTPTLDKVSAPQISEKKQSNPQEGLSLEKTRLEVHRFGITGYKKEQQRVFEQERAVMLGAKPPKKSYVNYKVLQQQIKDKKQKEKEEVQPDKKKKKQIVQGDKKSTSDPGAGSSGQVGRFKNGMLVLSSKEIDKIKGKK